MSEEKATFQPYPGWKMHVYGPARGIYNACIYYRMEIPMLALHKLGLVESFLDRDTHHFDKTTRDEQALLALLTADIDLLYAQGGDNGAELLDTLTKMRTGTLRGKIVYPPSTVYDIDDNLDWVHPYNNTFSFYGTRAADGHVLEPGESVGTRLANGKDIVAWQDQITVGDKGYVFDIARNKDFINSVHAFAKRCDGFTTPSPYLGKYMHETYGYPKPYIYPNSINPDDWKFRKFAPRKKEIRILWQGGGSHASDWYYLRPAMKFIAQKYKNVTFVFFGNAFSYVTDVIPEERVEIHPWVPFEAYRPTRAMLDIDINLCVLRDDEFSRSKSGIKFYEGAIQARPEVTLAANMPPYNEEIVDGETGLLYDVGPNDAAIVQSFVANLSHLIENVEARRRMADNAQKWVMDNRHYFKTAPGLHEYYTELRARKMAEHPYDAEADKLQAVKIERARKRAATPKPTKRVAGKRTKGKRK